MSTSKKYYVAYNNKQHGPISWDELIRNYPPHALIWKEGMAKWLPLSLVMPKPPPISTPPPPPPPFSPTPVTPPLPPPPTAGSQIDIRLLVKDRRAGLFVTIVGAALLAFGIIQYTVNQPRMFASSIGDWVVALAENIEKEKKRKQATRVMVIGGAFVVGGSIMLLTSKKSYPVSSIQHGNHKY